MEAGDTLSHLALKVFGSASRWTEFGYTGDTTKMQIGTIINVPRPATSNPSTPSTPTSPSTPTNPSTPSNPAPSTPANPTPSNPGNSGNLTQGSKGDDVKALQQALNANGANLKVDGSFGPATKAALEAFQRAHGLKADGIAGPKTLTELVNVTNVAKSTSTVNSSTNSTTSVTQNGELTLNNSVHFTDVLRLKLMSLGTTNKVNIPAPSIVTDQGNNKYTVSTTINNAMTVSWQLRDGYIFFYYNENDFKSIVPNGGVNYLAKEMFEVAKDIDSSYLIGRTVGGIKVELELHYAAYVVDQAVNNLTEFIVNTSSSVFGHFGPENARMGGMVKDAPGYDRNAIVFETVYKAQILAPLTMANR